MSEYNKTSILWREALTVLLAMVIFMVFKWFDVWFLHDVSWWAVFLVPVVYAAGLAIVAAAALIVWLISVNRK